MEKREVLIQIKNFCEKFIESRYHSVNKDITLEGEVLIIEARETFQMYSFLLDLENELKRNIKKYDVVVHGSWTEFD